MRTSLCTGLHFAILVDLERRRVIDLLPDRTAETLAEWLQAYPSVKIVARDRSSEYARGISAGAPQAEQVADRWHLLVNLREAFERLLDRLRPELNVLVSTDCAAESTQIPLLRRRNRSQETELAMWAHQQRRQALFTVIQRLRAESHTVRAIAHSGVRTTSSLSVTGYRPSAFVTGLHSAAVGQEPHHDIQVPCYARISAAAPSQTHFQHVRSVCGVSEPALAGGLSECIPAMA